MRTLAPGRRQVNVLSTQKREHSRKPDEFYEIIEACSPGPYLELFARYPRSGWHQWENELVEASRDSVLKPVEQQMVMSLQEKKSPKYGSAK